MATIVLYLFITTALSILVCYLIFKVITAHYSYQSALIEFFFTQIFVYREPLTPTNCFFFILMVSFFVAALYFFTGDRVASNWRVSYYNCQSLNEFIYAVSFGLSCPPLSLVLWTNHVKCCHSMITMMCGTSCPHVHCSSPSWYVRANHALHYF